MVKEVNKEHKNVKMTRKKKRSGIVYFDYSLLAILICLVCFGLVMLYSTSSYSAMMKQNGDSLFYFKRQLLFCIVGFIGMWLVSKIDYHWYINKSKLFYFFSIFIMFSLFRKGSKWRKKVDQTSIWTAASTCRNSQNCCYIIYSGTDLYDG